jgi:hypothetical protein
MSTNTEVADGDLPPTGGVSARTGPVAPNAERFAPLPPARKALWESMLERMDGPFFPTTLGFVVEEVRTDYARLRLPYRAEFTSPRVSCTVGPSPV